MLSDEEREALEILELYFGENSALNITKYVNIVLNLIEKQSKEIEELKAISEYREKIIKGLGLKTLPKTITGFKELVEKNDKKWEDKIKAKIEEVNIKLENYEADKINIFSGQTYMEKFKLLGELYGLQSLLEKE